MTVPELPDSVPIVLVILIAKRLKGLGPSQETLREVIGVEIFVKQTPVCTGSNWHIMIDDICRNLSTILKIFQL
jgi:hypothetical protein